MIRNEVSSNDHHGPAVVSADLARSDLQVLKAKLAGLQSARANFIAHNTFDEAKRYDQDITDTKLAIEQAEIRLATAEKAESSAVYAADQKQKALIFAAATLTNNVFWLKFAEEYDQASTRLMAVLEAGEVMCRQIMTINTDSKPDGMDPLSYGGMAVDAIRSRLAIPASNGIGSYFGSRQRVIAYADGCDPVSDFLKSVNDQAKTLMEQARAISNR